MAKNTPTTDHDARMRELRDAAAELSLAAFRFARVASTLPPSPSGASVPPGVLRHRGRGVNAFPLVRGGSR